MLHYEPSLWKEYYSHVKYNPVCIDLFHINLFLLKAALVQSPIGVKSGW